MLDVAAKLRSNNQGGAVQSPFVKLQKLKNLQTPPSLPNVQVAPSLFATDNTVATSPKTTTPSGARSVRSSRVCTRETIRWCVKSAFDAFDFRPDDKFVAIRKEGVVATMRYNRKKESTSIIGNGRAIALSKTVSRRFAQRAFDSFSIVVFAKMGKVIGRNITILTHDDVDDVTIGQIANILRENKTRLRTNIIRQQYRPLQRHFFVNSHIIRNDY